MKKQASKVIKIDATDLLPNCQIERQPTTQQPATPATSNAQLPNCLTHHRTRSPKHTPKQDTDEPPDTGLVPTAKARTDTATTTPTG
jgi:hypothetical protein